MVNEEIKKTNCTEIMSYNSATRYAIERRSVQRKLYYQTHLTVSNATGQVYQLLNTAWLKKRGN